MSESNLPYFGVSYVKKSSKPWRAAVVRAGINFFLGGYALPMDAADAVDNATYYLRPFTTRRPTYNFPEKWTNTDVAKENEYTKAAVARMREKFPQLEKRVAKVSITTTADRMENAADEITGGVIMFAEKLRLELRLAAGMQRAADTTIKAQGEEIERLQRTIKGLQNLGGQHFQRIGGETVPATAVEAQLG